MDNVEKRSKEKILLDQIVAKAERLDPDSYSVPDELILAASGMLPIHNLNLTASPVQGSCTGCSHCDTAITVGDVERIVDESYGGKQYDSWADHHGCLQNAINRIKSLIQSHTDTADESYGGEP